MQDEGFSNWYQTTVSRTEKADRDPSVFEVIALARIFGTTVEAMAGSTSEPMVDYAAGLRHAVALLGRELSQASALPDEAPIGHAGRDIRVAGKAHLVEPKAPLDTQPAHVSITTLLTLDEAAARLRKSPAQMRWLRHNGEGPKCAKVGGRVMYREQDITDWINKAFEEES